GSWRGYSWWERRRRHLLDMNRFLRAGDYDGLERTYEQDCRKYARPKVAERAALLPFAEYETSLETGVRWAGAEAAVRGGRAGYFSLPAGRVSDWQGEFVLVADDPGSGTEPRSYVRLGEPLARQEGPGFREAGTLFLMEGGNNGPLDPESLRHYVYARTA